MTASQSQEDGLLWLIIDVLWRLAAIFFAVLLLRWKKLGFQGLVGLSLIAFIFNLYVDWSIGHSLRGFAGILILYGLLRVKMRIKQNNVSTWENLE
jgi:hypothetical protein